MAELSEDAKTVFEALPVDGAMKGNKALMKQLGIDGDRFFTAKNELLKEGFIVTGRGRGGSTGRKIEGKIAESPEAPAEIILKSIPAKRVLSESAKKILDSLPKDGSMVGNTALRKRLEMDISEFFKAKSELQEQEKVITGKGRGGSIGLVKIISELPDRRMALGGVRDEKDLYDPIKKWFDENWGPNYTSPDYYCAVITGSPKGHKRRSGLWSRPDVSILTVSSYQFLPTKQIEVTTVEAKRYRDTIPQAVFETASQSKSAHQAYLFIEWLEGTDMDDTDNDNIKRIMNEAQRFGIGIVQMKKNAQDGWDFTPILEPKRQEPDPDECNSFIERAFRQHHQQILGALGKR